MKKKMKCVVALLLCMTMVFGTNLSTLADGNVVLSEQQAEPKNDQTTVTGDETTEAPAAENPDGQTEEKQEDTKTEDNTDASAQTPETPAKSETPAKPETSKDSQEQQAGENKQQVGQEAQKNTSDVVAQGENDKQSASDSKGTQPVDEDKTVAPKDMTVENLYEYLLNIKDDNEYEKVWDSLSEVKKEELSNYIQTITKGESHYYDNTEGIVSSLDVAPLILNEKQDVASTKQKKTGKTSKQKNSNNKYMEPSDGLKMGKEITKYDSKTGKGTLKLESYVTGDVATSKTVPLDIVLVLDQSGSMGENFGKVEYVVQEYTNGDAYNAREELYVYRDGKYLPITVEQGKEGTEGKEILSSQVTFDELEESVRKGNKYYYDIDGKRQNISVTKERKGGTFLGYWQYTVYAGETKIAEGRTDYGVNNNMVSGYPSGIYQISVQYEYTYKLKDNNEEIGRSKGANGLPPVTLFVRSNNEGDSKLESLKVAASNFIDNVAQNAAETGTDHRIAVVGFGSAGFPYGWENTELFVGENQYNYSDKEIESQYKNAFQNTEEVAGIENLHKSIYSLKSSGATRVEYGFKMANEIFKNNSIDKKESNDLERKRVVVMFSDGTPGDTGYSESVANSAIKESYATKNTYGASVYSVGILGGANGRITYDKNSIPHAVPESGWEWSYNKTNRFMHLISQNYPNAQDMDTNKKDISRDLTLIDENEPFKGYNSYYLSAANSDELNSVFEKIADEIGGAKIKLDSSTILQDTMSDYFKVDSSSGSEDIKVSVMQKTEEGNWTNDPDFEDKDKLKVTKENGYVQVTGFDYSKYYDAADHPGKKLVVEIPIIYKDETSFGGNDIPTNDELTSGIYNKGQCYGNFKSPTVNMPIDYEIGKQNKTIYITNSADLGSLMKYVENYKPNGTNNKFVNITYELKSQDENTKYGTLFIPAGKSGEDATWTPESAQSMKVSPKTCTKYQLTCTVRPITNGKGAFNPDEAQKDKTLEAKEPQIHVLIPKITAKDQKVFLGEEVDLTKSFEVGNDWKDIEKHTDIPNPEGEAPKLKIIPEFVEGSKPIKDQPYKPEADSNFKIGTVMVNDQVVSDEQYVLKNAESLKDDDCYKPIVNPKQHDFTIHVVAGEIEITKVADIPNWKLDGESTFTFEIKKENGPVWYRSVTMDKSTTDNTATTELLSGLPKGEYTITELDTIKYDKRTVDEMNDSDCPVFVNDDKKSVTVYIGYTDKNNSTTKLESRYGHVKFENTRTNSKQQTDSDVRLNRFTKDKDGNWSVKPYEVPQNASKPKASKNN